MMRTVFKAFLIAVTVAAFSVLAAGVASAAATASLVWVGTTGSGAVGTSSINAAPGDIITLDILYTVSSVAVKSIFQLGKDSCARLSCN